MRFFFFYKTKKKRKEKSVSYRAFIFMVSHFKFRHTVDGQ